MPPTKVRRSAVALLAAAGALLSTVLVPTSALAAPHPREAAPRQQEPQKTCDNRTSPPPPVDNSEQPKPGKPSPQPPSVPDQPVGGPRMGECGDVLPAGAPTPPPELAPAASWLVADIDTGEVLAAHNPHARQRPASTIKVLTALTALRELKLDDKVTATEEDAAVEPTKVGLVPGKQYSVRHLLTALLIMSGNDAAHAIGRQLGGQEQAVAKMNKLARELGALDTQASTTSGLDGPGQMTSAYDLALIFRAAMANTDFREMDRQKVLDMPNLSPARRITNDNKLIHEYRQALGGKTGFTDDALHTYIGAAEKNNRRLVVTVLRTSNQPAAPWLQGAKLLDYAFVSLPRNATKIGELVDGPPKPASNNSGVTTTGPAPQPAANKEQDNLAAPPANNGDSTPFGTVGLPLTALAGVAVLAAGFMTFRRKRAIARRRAMSG
ncbi:D-alanyl-D-alanine carboxypeptidase family protein [Streptoalloteichus hindustanus]|uniref:D-alanyl-D-alanine carboxypeptidase (Penicillin-binding protein 5/6) n=1 Tax=Streptoalloteichus hindustanus TaxID=2017 RepID=A0A1M5KCF9_STRHI|nr:D-alanyl-D-alanine carboxypeptidase family protein [Streptoalloteichus hindustanus]SHG50427.1 D-alanyl-D-alanine carboxypeptidase (penicillin-binding protein 5/6) [Streptoalloteichus hindustanus]